MKRTLSFILAMVLLLSFMPTGILGITANAASSSYICDSHEPYYVKHYYYSDGSSKTEILACYTSVSGELVIPSSLNGDVTWLCDDSFSGCDKITSVVIPDTVGGIGAAAFENCTSLTSATIPSSVKTIKGNAFANCDNLIIYCEASKAPSGWASNWNSANCPVVWNYKNNDVASDGYIYVTVGGIRYGIKDGVATVVKPLSNLSGKVNVPSYVTHKNIKYPVTNIGNSAFSGCTEITEITIPCSVTDIADSAFENCTSLIDVWYEGNEHEFDAIVFGNNNVPLTNAVWHYNYCTKHNGQYKHIYDSCEDADCNNCGKTRITVDHVYDDCDDASCNNCGVARGVPAHIYDYDCYDRSCNVCDFIRDNDHFYSNDWDKNCDICGEIRNVGPFTITYHLDGGANAAKNPDVYTEEDTIILKGATKVGYDFVGWFLDADKTEPVTEICMMGNVELYAKFLPKAYNVTFDSNGADKASPITITLHTGITNTKKTVTVNNGESFSPYDYWQPKVSGYVFVGWMHNSQLIGEQIEITDDIDLYAKWVENPNGYPVLGEDVTSITAHGAEKYFFISCNYTRIYYELLAQKRYAEVLSPTTHLVQYRYSASSHSSISATGLSASLPGYSSSGNASYTDSDYVTLEPGTLVRLYNGQSGDLGYFGNLAGYAEAKITTRETYNGLVASEIRTGSYEYDAVINAPSVSKTGYKFLGWYDSQGNQITDTWQYTSNQTFTAKWQPQGYEITYELSGGVNHASNPAVYTVENTITLKDPAKPGYTFKGWYADADFTTQVTSISKQTGNITLYAKWDVNTYNLTLDANTGVFAPKVTFVSDGKEIKSCYLYEEGAVAAYCPAAKDGYIFAGWYTDSAYTSLFKFSGSITNDITLYAKWMECNSNIVSVESVGKINTTIQGKTEQLYAFVPLADGQIMVTSESNGLDMYGILYDASKNVLTSADDISSTDLDFTYTYSVNAGQLYYISVKGTTASTAGQAVVKVAWIGDCTITGTTYQNRQLSVAYDTEYMLPQKPIREGYVFLGWFDENGIQITDGTWNFTTDKTLTAKWEEATYHTVVFKDLAGNVISSETYYLSEDIVAPALPTKAPDHTYIYHAKWDNDYTGVCTGDAVYSPTFDLEYIEYTVVFQDEDGTELSRATYHWGDAVTPPADPTKDADNTYTYKFAGWNKNVVACAGDAVYTATYAAEYIDYTVVFKNWNGDVLSTKTYHYGDKVTAPADPARAADDTYTYTFAGWDREVMACAGDAVYTATYAAEYIDYTVVFKNWNGDVLSTKTYHYGDKVTAPADPARAADETYTYTFAGWDREVMACAGDAVYTATYTPAYISYTVVFKNWDGTTVSSNTYHYGDRVTAPANPARAADDTYTYTFAGWDREVMACAGDATYTATYTATYIDYTVVFKNWDGSIISSNTYHYGDKVVVPADPTREADSTYIYIFDGWDKEVVNCTGDAVYTATYLDHAEHVFTDACDTTCNVCGHTRTIEHDYVWVVDKENDCGAEGSKHEECTVCHATRNVGTVIPATGEHRFTNACDTTCNVCGHRRTIEHNYVWVTEKANNCGVDGSKYERCTVCRATRNVGTVIPATGEHTYTNACDTSCNVCGQERVVDDHVYENVCDKDCNVCGYVRSAEHTYDNACDGTCNLCGTERTPADHVYDGGDYCTACALYAGLEYRRYSWEDTVRITGLDENYRGAFVIPATINGYPVTEIYYSAFDGCTGLTSVTIPDSVTEIGSRAFRGCTGLTSVTIPGSVTVIGGSAFSGCTDLTSVTIPDSVTEIGDYAFDGCTGLTSVTIPDSVTEIGVAAFYGCTDLTSVTIPDSVTEIGNSAFYGCTGLTSVTITDGVTKIGSGAFYGCTGLTSVAIPDGVTEIGEAAFSDCTGLTSVTIPDSVTEIGSRAFHGCTGLTSVTIPGSVTEIGGSAFYGCTGLTSVTITEGVTVIGDSAFSGCAGLTSVTIPGSVTEIGDSAFSDCTGLTSVTIPDSVTTVGKHAFSCCYGLCSITFGSGLTSIGMMAFMNCYNMEDVYITDVNAWCQIAFEDSYAVPYGEWHFLDENGNEITDITLDETVTQISSWAFSGCTGLTSVTIPDSVTAIGNYAFYGCTGLASVTIPENVSSIGAGAFNECSGLTSISVAKNNAVYHSSGNCLIETASKTLILGIKTSTIPSDGSVTIIGNSAFAYCEDLTFITIPDGVTTIESSAFYGCKGLTNVELPDSVTYLGGSAFDGCSNLTSVVLPAGVTTIEQFVFDGCYSLRYITIPKTVTYIRYAAIRGYSITDVYYSGSENDRAQLLIDDNNGNLPYATWHYNTCQKHTFDSICDNSCNACTWTRAVPGHHYPDGGGACDRCGHMQNGWVKENGIWYFYENGTMVKNAWRKDSKGWCYLLEDGSMATSMWLRDSKGWCYIEANGYCATNCWKKDSTGWIWLDANGSMTKNKWIKDGGKWYFLDANGYMVTNKWSKDSVGWVYCGADGAMLTNSWCKDSKGWCYVGADGYAVTNCWKKDSKGWIYLNSEGSMSYSKWIQDGGKWYYVDSTGYMVANRSLKIGGKTYSFNASGVCTNP